MARLTFLKTWPGNNDTPQQDESSWISSKTIQKGNRCSTSLEFERRKMSGRKKILCLFIRKEVKRGKFFSAHKGFCSAVGRRKSLNWARNGCLERQASRNASSCVGRCSQACGLQRLQAAQRPESRAHRQAPQAQ